MKGGGEHPETDPSAFDTLVLGIGNLLWADEGFGVRAVEALHAGWASITLQPASSPLAGVVAVAAMKVVPCRPCPTGPSS